MSSRARDALFFCAMLVATLAPTVTRAQEPANDAAARAAELAQQALERYQAGEPEEAIPLLLEARELYAEPLLLYNLARAYEALGRDSEALAAYRRYVEERPDAPDRAAMESHIDSLEAQIEERERLAREREEEERRRRRAEERAAEASGPSPWPFLVVAAGGATLGAAVVFGVLARSEQSAAAEEPSHRTRVARGEEAERLATIANVLFAVGGALALAGAGWLTIELVRGGGEESDAPALSLAPSLFGASVVGAF